MWLERRWPPSTAQRWFLGGVGALHLGALAYGAVESFTKGRRDAFRDEWEVFDLLVPGLLFSYFALLPSQQRPKYSVLLLAVAVVGVIRFTSRMLAGAQPPWWGFVLAFTLCAYLTFEARRHWLRGY